MLKILVSAVLILLAAGSAYAQEPDRARVLRTSAVMCDTEEQVRDYARTVPFSKSMHEAIRAVNERAKGHVCAWAQIRFIEATEHSRLTTASATYEIRKIYLVEMKAASGEWVKVSPLLAQYIFFLVSTTPEEDA